MMLHRVFPFLISATTLFFLAGCQDQSQDPRVESVSEIGASVVSGSVSGDAAREVSQAGVSRSSLGLIPEAFADNARCPTAATGVAGQNCSVDSTGKIMTLTYASCNFGNNSAVWNGSEILTSTQALTCGQSLPETDGGSLVRTFSPGTQVQRGNSIHVTTIDTEDPTGYQTPVSGGIRLDYVSSGHRTITISGVNLKATKEFRGNGNAGRIQAVWDHTISTVAGQPLDVSWSSGTKIVNGTLQVQHNLAKYTGTLSFDHVEYEPGCCHPRSGTITTTFSGSRTGTETLTFSSDSCGSSELRAADGSLTKITLEHCF